ncbi:MAG: porin [Comamonas sp.]
MKKTLIAFGAALVCMGAAHAQSNVQLSGLVDMYAGSMKLAGSDRTSEVGSGGLTTSWWGMSGTEDLGNGLKAGFALGAFFRADTGSAGRYDLAFGETFFARDANVSLSGGFGTLKLGRSMAPNFLPTILFNPFGDSFTVSPLVLHANMFDTKTTAADTGWSNQITYSTPTFGGLSANLHYQFGEQAGQNSKKNVGANVMFFQGPVALTAFIERAQINNPTPSLMGDTKQNWMLGASYNFGAAKLFATHGHSELKDSLTYDAKTTSLGLDVPVTKAGTLKAAVAHTKADISAANGIKRTPYTLGYDHFLSKRTDVYSVVMHDKRKQVESETGTSFAVGIRHRF